MTWSRGPAIGMFFAAAVELLIGGTFVCIALSGLIPEVSTTFLIVGGALCVGGVVFILIGRRLLARFQEGRRLRETGVRAGAQVLNVRQTSLMINNQPQVELTLQVLLPDRPPYQVTLKEVVPLLALGRLGSGQPLAVLVDPQEPTKLVIDWSGTPAPFNAPFGASGAVPFGASGPAPFNASGAAASGAVPLDPAAQQRMKQEILATGVPGTARVLSANFTGDLDELSRPIYNVQLHVAVDDGRPPVAGPGRFAVPVERVSVMQPGGTIPIKVDRFDPAKMAADWDRFTR